MRASNYADSRPVNFARYRGRPVSIMMDRSIPRFILEELAKHPHCEDGGKYLAFIESDHGSSTLVVSDFLPGGPNAKRTRVEFLPDGDFQEQLFRQAELLDSRVEHVGSWHSHHCNGLQSFSEGDIVGYFKTVNKPRYRPDFFLASLVTRIPSTPDEPDWLHHFLFARGDDSYYVLGDQLNYVDSPTTFGEITGHCPAHRRKSAVPGRDNGESPSLIPNLVEPPPLKNVNGLWYESEMGRQVLADDRKFFGDAFGAQVKATRAGGRIKLTGAGIDSSAITIIYPATTDDDVVEVILTPPQNRTITISCHMSERVIALKGALCMQGLL